MYVKGIRHYVEKCRKPDGTVTLIRSELQMCIQQDGVEVWVPVPEHCEEISCPTNEIHTTDWLRLATS